MTSPDWTKAVDEAFPIETILDIAKRHNFSGEDERWNWYIRKAARSYLISRYRDRARFDEQLTSIPTEFVQPPLDDVIVPARNLLDELKSFPALRDILSNGRLKLDKREDPNCSTQEYQEADAFYDQAVETVSALIAALEHQHRFDVPQKRGPKIDLALVRFIEYLREFWRWHLDRPFTLDYHKGEGTSAAYSFIADCLAPLGETASTRLITAMRRVIADFTHRNSGDKS